MIDRCGTVGLFFLCGLFFLVTTVSGQALSPLSENEMSGVTGREGLAVDLDLNAQMDSLQFTDGDGSPLSGDPGRLIVSNVTLDNGSGGAAGLNNLTINADGSNDRLSIGGPSGQFSTGVGELCVDIPGSNTGCGFRPSFGSFELGGINTNNTTVHFSGRGSGLTIGADLNATADRFRWTDADGNGTDNSGFFQLGSGADGIELRDGTGGAANLTDLNIDADGNGFIAVDAPSSPSLDLLVDAIYLGDASSSVGSLEADYVNFGSSSLEVSSADQGLSLDLTLDGDMDFLAFEDANGVSGTGGAISLGSGFFGVSVGNGSGGAANLTGAEFHVDDSDGLYFGHPSGNLTASFEPVQLGTGSGGVNLTLNGYSAGSSSVIINGTGEGLTADIELQLDFQSIDLGDPDGHSGNDNEGVVRFGGGSFDLDIGDGCCGTADLTGLTLDFDPNQGAVIGAPSGTFDVLIEEVLLGDGSNFGSPMGGIEAGALDLSSSEARLSGHGEGLDLELLLNLSANYIEITDDDGWDGGSGTGGALHASNPDITLDDGSGNPASLAMDVDGNRGMVTQFQDATLDLQTDTVFLGSDQGGSPSPVTGNVQMDGTTVGVFSR